MISMKLDKFLAVAGITAVREPSFKVKHNISHYIRGYANHQPYLLTWQDKQIELIHRTGGREYWYFESNGSTLIIVESMGEVIRCLERWMKGLQL